MSVTERELQAALVAFEALAEQGPKGDKGDPGEPGRDGANGRDGEPGVTGPKGERGPVGADGAIGPRGVPGIPGLDGQDGADGRDGAAGPAGRDGKDGERGPRGATGDKGDPGEKGDRGPEGPAGRSTGGGGTPFRGMQIVTGSIPPPVFAQSLEIGAGLSVEMYAPGAARLSAVGGGSDANYVHDQVLAASTWTVDHNLGKFPAVTVVDSSGDVCVGDIHYVNPNRVTVAFGAAFSGVAYVN